MSGAGTLAASLARIDREGFAAFVMRMRAANITDRTLITAIEATPRRAFADPQYHNAVWSSRTIPIDCGEVIEGLDLQATIIHALKIGEENRVLEIGTGSGYSAAVMGRLAKRVFTIERFKRLNEGAQSVLREATSGNVIAVQGDGAEGSGEGPFDRIVAWAAFDAIPRAFVDQLVSGGVIVCAIGEADMPQVLVRLTKVGSRFEREDIGMVRFQPVVRGLPLAL